MCKFLTLFKKFVVAEKMWKADRLGSRRLRFEPYLRNATSGKISRRHFVTACLKRRLIQVSPAYPTKTLSYILLQINKIV